MATQTTIHKKLYTTIQYRGDTNNDDGLLGFASPYTKDAAFEKRKDTQDSWAYGRGIKVEIDDNDDITVTGSGSNYYGNSKGQWDASMLFIANCYPRIIDNEPVEGFQIAKSVRRYGWNGGGNVKWRITDPRGFDLEISSENFASVLSCSTMINGVIQGKCVWGRQGANNILLPEASEPYQAAVKATVKANSKVSLKDIMVGDIVEITSSKIPERDQTCQYLGKYFFLTVTHGNSNTSTDSDYYRNDNLRVFNKRQVEQYLFKSCASGEYFTVGSPKVALIKTPIGTPLNKNEVAKEFSAKLSEMDYSFDISGTILASDTKIDLDKVTSELTPAQVNLNDWPTIDRYYYRSFVAKFKGALHVTVKPYRHDPTNDKLRLTPIEYSPTVLTVKQTAVQNNSYYYGRNRTIYQNIEITDFEPEELEFFKITVKYNNLVGEVTRV